MVCRGSTDPRSKRSKSLLIDPPQTLSEINVYTPIWTSQNKNKTRAQTAIVFLLKDQTQTYQIKTNTKGQIGSVSRPRRPNLIRFIWGASPDHAKGVTRCLHEIVRKRKWTTSIGTLRPYIGYPLFLGGASILFHICNLSDRMAFPSYISIST